jgi:hypothetical protein
MQERTKSKNTYIIALLFRSLQRLQHTNKSIQREVCRQMFENKINTTTSLILRRTMKRLMDYLRSVRLKYIDFAAQLNKLVKSSAMQRTLRMTCCMTDQLIY